MNGDCCPVTLSVFQVALSVVWVTWLMTIAAAVLNVLRELLHRREHRPWPLWLEALHGVLELWRMLGVAIGLVAMIVGPLYFLGRMP